MACLLKVNVNELTGFFHIYDLRAAYLMFFIVGTVLSIGLFILGLVNKLPHKLVVKFNRFYIIS